MIYKVLGIFFGLTVSGTWTYGQDFSRTSRIETDSTIDCYYFKIEVPMGQSFINKGRSHTHHTARFHFPEEHTQTKVTSDRIDTQMRTHMLMLGGKTSHYAEQLSTPHGGQVTMRGGMTTNADPTQYISELRPALNQPIDLELHLGHGGAWIDLSDLRTREVEIMSSASDVFLTYNKPNLERMHALKIDNAMGKIVLRNLEYARAEQINVDNGMGDTKIILGEQSFGASYMRLGVGTGRCVMMVHDEAPLKIVLKGTVFSSVNIPDSFMETGDNTFVNLAYKKHPEKAMTAVIDAGLGSFSLINYR